ncbi:MAG: hypothetical protein MI919_37870 [Holophagales bacterium]|nr:hypothetical protein [Holophagales bacterium]
MLWVGLGSTPLAAEGASVGWFESMRIERQAQAALAAGEGAAASEAFGRLIGGLETGKKRHGRALHGAALAELQKPEAERDLDLARLWLDRFLADYPSHSDRAAARSLRNALTAPAPKPEKRPAPPPAPPAPASEDPETNARVEVLESRIAQLRAELAATQEELAKKDEALRKLKEVVVGGDG